MSTIDRSSNTGVGHSSAKQVQAGAAPKTAVFDPTKAAIDQQIVRSNTPDAFTAAIREATDGDGDEAVQRRMVSGGDPDEKSVQTDGADQAANHKSKTRKSRSLSGAEQDKDEGAAKAKKTEVKDTVQNTESVATSLAELSQQKSHKQLMIVSANMTRNQTASFVTKEAAQKVQNILEGDLWERDASRNRRLKIAQVLKVS